MYRLQKLQLRKFVLLKTLRSPCRFYAGSALKFDAEPPFAVSPEPYVDVSDLIVPIVADSVREEIYAKHTENPEQWNLTALSKHFRASEFRIKAILILMEIREEKMKSLGMYDDPELWEKVYSKHRDDTNVPTSELSDLFGIAEQEVVRIISAMDEHAYRAKNLQDMEGHFGGLIEDMKNAGVNTQFQETPGRNKAKANYFPQLVDDDRYTKELHKLQRRLTSETKAKAASDVQYYLRTYGDDEPKYSIDSNLQGAMKEVSTDTAAAETPSRWKLAFRDLSYMNDKNYNKTKLNSSAGEVSTLPPVTMIRTRMGGRRSANPWEEATRSWNKRPSPLEIAFHKKELAKYTVNFDGDDEAVAAHLQSSRAEKRSVEKG